MKYVIFISKAISILSFRLRQMRAFCPESTPSAAKPRGRFCQRRRRDGGLMSTHPNLLTPIRNLCARKRRRAANPALPGARQTV
jgi:hypothetical protein